MDDSDSKKPKKIMRLTTFQLPENLYVKLRMMCLLTNASMGKFIRESIREKIKSLKGETDDIT